MQFQDLALNSQLLNALDSLGYSQPTPIQSQAIPAVLSGRDVLGCAQTGTGKTAAFALPMLHLLDAQGRPPRMRPIRAVILSPTRELAQQINESLHDYNRYMFIRSVMIFGGVSAKPQIERLRQGVDIVVATPGRLLDLMNQGHVNLSKVQMLVLDEADRMLDMGFLPDVKRIISKLPQKRQNLLFSATMPASILELANEIMHDPLEIAVAPESTTVEAVEQAVYYVADKNKISLLNHLLLQDDAARVLVFTRTRHAANRLAERLSHSADAIHSDKSQAMRMKALERFKKGKLRVLVATDIASRGLDIDKVSHVINYDLPLDPESYVHRIGRTARAGENGVAISFCNPSEQSQLKRIERSIRQNIAVVSDHPYAEVIAPSPAKSKPKRWGTNKIGGERNGSSGYDNGGRSGGNNAKRQRPAQGNNQPKRRSAGNFNPKSRD